MSAIQIQLPEPVHRRAAKLAREQAISLEELLVIALVEKLSTIPDEKLETRARRASAQGFRAFMDRAPDVEPEDYDKLPPARRGRNGG